MRDGCVRVVIRKGGGRREVSQANGGGGRFACRTIIRRCGTLIHSCTCVACEQYILNSSASWGTGKSEMSSASRCCCHGVRVVMGCRAAAVEGGGEREEGEKEEYSAGHGFCCDLRRKKESRKSRC